MDEKGQRPQHSVNLSQAEDSVADGQSISSLAMSIEEILSQNSLLGKTHCNNHLDGVVVSDVSINLHLVGIQTYPLEEPKRGFVLMAVGSHGSHDGLVHVSSTCLGDLSWVEVFTPPSLAGNKSGRPNISSASESGSRELRSLLERCLNAAFSVARLKQYDGS